MSFTLPFFKALGFLRQHLPDSFRQVIHGVHYLAKLQCFRLGDGNKTTFANCLGLIYHVFKRSQYNLKQITAQRTGQNHDQQKHYRHLLRAMPQLSIGKARMTAQFKQTYLLPTLHNTGSARLHLNGKKLHKPVGSVPCILGIFAQDSDHSLGVSELN